MSEKKQDTLIHDLTEGPVTKQLLQFALPIMGANLMMALYTLVDLWVVGNFASSATVSAVSIAGQVVFILHCVGIGLGNGGQVLISQQVGSKDLANLSRSVGTLMSFAAVSSVIMAAIGAIGNGLWLTLMQTPAAAYDESVVYLLICCIGVPFVYLQGTACAILRGVGDSSKPMYILGLSTIINVVLDLIFVAGFGWAAAGAAWATIIAQIISTIYAIIILYRARKALNFDFRPASFKMHGGTLKVALKLSIPLIVMNASINISMMVVTAFVNTYGVAASAITGIGGKLNSLVNVITSSMQTAVSGMVAQNFAAGKTDRVRKINRSSNLVCIAFFVICAICCLAIPRQIIGLFDPDPEVLALAADYMFIAMFLYLAFCTMTTSIGHINGVGYTSYNLIIAIIDGVIGRIGLCLLFGKVMGMGVEGYWWGNALSSYISVILAPGYYFFGKWEKRSILKM